MDYFVKKDSIVRTIWGKGDTILFIFAGAAAEFALNKAVDWLYFTGKLPSDPLGRLFSTVGYARLIVFAEREKANSAIDKMSSIHSVVEASRGAKIPDWAYRDVLFMLIHYSISSFEVLERKLSPEEKEEVYNVFYHVGMRMALKDLPVDYQNWLPVRDAHLAQNLQKSNYTIDLFQQYKKHLGNLRYTLLLQAQKMVVPQRVKILLGFGKTSFLKPILPVYKITRSLKLDWLLKYFLLPQKYKVQIKDLDVSPH